MSQSSNPHGRLPLELLRVIFLNLSTGVDDIKSCCLVCRAWLPDARRVLFHKLKVQEYSDYSKILATLRAAPEIRSCVKHLEIKIYNNYQWVQRTNTEDVCSFLSEHAPESLESLKLDIYELEYEAEEELISACCMYLARLSGLKSFNVHVSLLKTSKPYNIVWLCQALSNLPPTIEEIRIEIPAEGVDMAPNPKNLIWQWDRIDWADIDKVINADRFPHLRRVTVVFEIHFNYTRELKEWAIRQLSQLAVFKLAIMDIVFREPTPEISFSSSKDEGDSCPTRGCFLSCGVQ